MIMAAINTIIIGGGTIVYCQSTIGEEASSKGDREEKFGRLCIIPSINSFHLIATVVIIG